MSGSPIIQDGKLVGAVTHVLLNAPDTGYGIFIESIEGKYDPDEKEGEELAWRKLANGDYVLSTQKDGVSMYFSHAGTLEQMVQ